MRLVKRFALTAAVVWVASAAHAQELPTFKLEMKNGQFTPTEIVVPANTRFKLELHNTGTDAEEFESLELKKEKVLAPGATSFLVFAPLKPGSYRFFGEFHPDTAQGHIVSR
ncbi:MAG: cupredoxin domain-containing protein [Giesbergeria sp.]